MLQERGKESVPKRKQLILPPCTPCKGFAGPIGWALKDGQNFNRKGEGSSLLRDHGFK